MKRLPIIALTAAVAILAGCSNSKPDTASPAQSTTVAATADDTTAANTAAASAAGSSAGNYAAFIGKYPFDKVDGSTFLERPEVASAIRAAVGDAALLRTIHAVTGPSAPIFQRDGKIGAWQCQQHQCDAQQWAVLFDPATATAEVCYTDIRNEASAQPARWFSGGKISTRTGDCPSN